MKMKNLIDDPKRFIVVLALIFFWAMAGAAWAASADDSFNPGANYNVYCIALQPDGKILVGGEFTTIGGQTRNHIARLHTDGSVDAGFNPNVNGSLYSIRLQPDGKILVAGSFSSVGGQTRNSIARLNDDGSVDTSFDPGANGIVRSIVLQADGKVLVGGFFTSVGGQTRNYIARLHADGSLDESFNPGASSAVYSIVLQADGKILVGGSFTTIGGQARDRIARLNSDGSVDAGFNPGATDTVYSLALQPDGQIVAGGNFTSIGGQARDRIARLNSDGSVDMSFNPGANGPIYSLVLQADGKILVGGNFTSIGGQTHYCLARLHGSGSVDGPFSPGANNTVSCISLQDDGKILLGGWFTQVILTRNYIARLSADGRVETSFNPGASDSVLSMALQPDGKIVVGGSFTTIYSQARDRIARLICNGNVDTAFTGATSVVYAIALQPDGKILVGGAFTSIGGQTRNYIARLNADCSVDAGFNPAANNFINSIVLQPDGKILVGGWFTTIGGQTRNRIARLNGDGSVDAGFTPNVNGTLYSICLQPDGKILLGGAFIDIGGLTRNRIARLNADGSVDGGFDPNANGILYSICLQTDGKILVGGAFTYIDFMTRNRIARLNGNGSVDTGFNPGADDYVRSFALQANGKILVGGSFTTIGGLTRNRIARLNADGSVDTSFNPGANNAVNAVALQADGKVLVGGVFTEFDGETRNRIARLSTDEAALQHLSVSSDGTEITWTRGQSSPEIHDVTFEHSDDMATWTFLGAGMRIAGGWHLDGQSLTPGVIGYVRARGLAMGGLYNASTSQMESVRQYYITPPPTLTVTSPNGGESWMAGTSQEITWTSAGGVGNVNIDFSINSGSSWNLMAMNTANDGTYLWTVPEAISDTCLVRVQETDGWPSDQSDAVFTIAEPAESVSAPDTPTGPATGLVSTSYDYSTGNSTSSLGHDVQYMFDWDDGSDSGWLAVGTTSASHGWAAAGTYDVRAMARCATHPTVESLWSITLGVTISDGTSAAFYNSPAQRLFLPEATWAPASGSGDWVSELQLVDCTGGSTVQVYYNTGTSRRGPFTLWSNSGGAAGSSVMFGNVIQTIDNLDGSSTTYYGTGGALELVTQDGSHLLQAAVRSYNGNFSRTFPALADVETNTAAVGRSLIIPNLSNDTGYRPSVVLFNPSADSVTVEGRIVGSDGVQVGGTINRTLAGFEQNTIVTEVRSDTYSNADFRITVTGGSGRVIASGQSANNTSNDPAAHLAVQTAAGFANSMGNRLVLPETTWALAAGSGDWVSEVHVTDLSGGTVVTAYYNTGTSRRGPFTLWTNGGGVGCSTTFGNILQTLDNLDGSATTYYGTGGSLELLTQDGSHLIQAAVRTFNGNFSRTFPGLLDREETTAAIGRVLLIPNICNNSSYRPSVILFNPTADSVTVEVKIVGSDGSQLGSTINRVLAAFQQNTIVDELRAFSYDNAKVQVTVTAGAGRVIVSGQSANNVSNDPAAHVAVQGQ
jgi:uncharacterized delta-60 repeat protein